MEFSEEEIIERGRSFLRRFKIELVIFGVLFIKFYALRWTNGGALLGADGENYLTGVTALENDGIFSHDNILQYWPAGYPLLLLLVKTISFGHFWAAISIMQSTFFAFATYFFLRQIRDTKLGAHSLGIALIISLNPTLSLATLVIGYEAPIAACMLFVTGLIVRNLRTRDRSLEYPVAVGLVLGLAAFMQPRWILTSIIIAALWFFAYRNMKKSAALITVVMLSVMAIAPLALITRNVIAGNGAVISTNLGVTMRIGAGDATNGSYDHTGPQVPCEPTPPAKSVTDNQVVKCVIDWYLHNPGKAAKLFVNKAIYFWSPWSGPMMYGTMARNPWLSIDPVMKIAHGSQNGAELIFGTVGKVISWIWEFATVALLFIGFFWLRAWRGIYRHLAYLALLPCMASWIVAMGTIGDHRFRIPTMTLSLFLQVMGLYALKERVDSGSFEPNSAL